MYTYKNFMMKSFILHSNDTAPATAYYVRLRLVNPPGVYSTWSKNVDGELTITIKIKVCINATDGFAIYKGDEKTFGVNNRGEAFFKGEIIQLAEVGGKETRVEISPTKGFALSMKQGDQWQKHIYITDSSGWSGAGILVTSKYDVNEDHCRRCQNNETPGSILS